VKGKNMTSIDATQTPAAPPSTTATALSANDIIERLQDTNARLAISLGAAVQMVRAHPELAEGYVQWMIEAKQALFLADAL
jgi:hypothetical protein